MIRTDDVPVLASADSLTEETKVAARLLWISLLWRDPATARHCRRVSEVAKRLGMKLGLAPRELRIVTLVALLHDAGKIRSDQIARTGGPPPSEE